jgi:signal transduction histidine kinase/CheY-like chemotaxis protein/ligand-binding sensor domain-containing protein
VGVVGGWVWLIGVASAATSKPAELPGWQVDQWTVQDGLWVDNLTDISVADDGMVWIGTFDGFVRFDGDRFRTWRVSSQPELGTNATPAIVTRDGGVWVLNDLGALLWTDGVQVRRVDTGSAEFEHPFQFLDSSVGLFAQGTREVLRLADGRAERIAVLPGESVAALPELGLWSATEVGVVAVGADGRWEPWHRAEARVDALAQAADGAVWIGGRGGLIRSPLGDAAAPQRIADGFFCEIGVFGAGIVARAADGWWRADASGAAPIGLSAPPCSGDRRDRLLVDGSSIWLAGKDSVWRDGQRVASVGAPIQQLRSDRAGGVWVATEGAGLVRLRPAAVTPLPVGPDVVTALLVTPEGDVWLADAKETDGVTVVRGGVARSLSLGLGASPGEPARARALFHDAEGAVGVVSWFHGVARCTPAGCGPHPAFIDSGVTQRLVSAQLDAAGGAWLASEQVLLHRPAGAAWREVKLPDGRPIIANGLAEQADGRMFALGEQGVARLSSDGVDLLDVSSGLSASYVRGAWSDPKGDLWLATRYNGLCRVVGGRFVAPEVDCLGMKEGMYDDALHAVVGDAQGRVWVSGNRGISWFDLEDAASVIAGRTPVLLPVAYTDRDGMRSREANGMAWPSSQVAADGALWFPTQRGAVRIDPARVERPAVPPVTLDLSSPASVDGVVRLEAHDRSVTVRWVAPQPDWPQLVRFQARIGDGPWRLAEGRSATWTRLPPGEAVVEVRAGFAGQWGPATPLLRVISPPAWYETSAARFGVVFAGLGLVYAGFRAWDRMRAARERALEAEVARRTDALRRAHAQVEEQAHRLAEVDSLKSAFAVSISHEIRTPLTLITGPLDDLLDSSVVNDPSIRRRLELMRRNGERLRELVDHVLDITRLDAGGIPLRARRMDLGDLVRETCSRFVDEYRRQGVRLDAPDGGVVAWVDPNLVDKIVSNLLANALRFSPVGARVTVQVVQDGGDARVTVSDEGPGVPEPLRERVFERFFRLSSPENARHDGAGIGLALSRELVELHGGEIGIDAAEGGGAAFWFRVPVGAGHLVVDDVDQGPASLKVPTGPPRAAEGPLVLVVEDHPELRAYLVEHLQDRFEVVEAVDGEDALLQIRARAPAAVVSDVLMPRLDGLALTRALRADPATASIAVVLVSAKAGADAESEGLADAFFAKPFRMREVVARVAELTCTSAAPAPSAGDRALVARVVAFVKAHLTDATLSVDRVAQHVARSRRTLQRDLARAGAGSPQELITQVRMDVASELLRSGLHATVGEVAAQVGLSRQHFVRLYSSWHGRSPSEDLSR